MYLVCNMYYFSDLTGRLASWPGLFGRIYISLDTQKSESQVKKLKEFKQKSVYAHNHRPYLDSQIYSSQSGHLEVQKLIHGGGMVLLTW